MKRNLTKKKKSKRLVGRFSITDEDLQQHLLMQKKFRDYYCPKKSDNPIMNLILIATFLNDPEVKAIYSKLKTLDHHRGKFVMVDQKGHYFL